MIKYSDLNENQQIAVKDESKHIRVIAGAGSGKTRVLTMRVVYLIEKMHIKPNHILAITFTNKAANEMKSRIIDYLKDASSGVNVSTIHSLCLRILKEDIEKLNYPRNFTVCDAEDQKTILREAYKKYGIKREEIPFGTSLEYIANNKYEAISPEIAKKSSYGDAYLIKKASVYEYYQERLKELYALDFDDLILWTNKLFSMDENIKNKWAKRFEHVLVDEFQDIDKAQYQLIRFLSCVHDNIYVVGDPDQTIYTWRGADVNIIMNFVKDYKDVKNITLDENYRSTNNILSGSNSLIKNNKMRVEKNLYSKNGDGDKIQHYSFETYDLQSAFISSEIKKLNKRGIKYNNIAVLYRSNYLSRNVENSLILNRIPYVIYGGIRFYERAEVKDVLSYLRLLVVGDDLSFQRIINVPKRGIGNKTIESIFRIAKENNVRMYDVLKNRLYPKTVKAFDDFVEVIEKLKNDLASKDLEKIVNNVIDKTGYRKMLEENMETERLENIKSLIDDVIEFSNNYPDSSLDDYLQAISLYTDKDVDDRANSVKLMTIHSSKGLEFDTVFVVDISEGVFPNQRALQDGPKAIEEERRLAYVAFTRAKNNLYLLENSNYSHVLSDNKTASRFIREINDDYIDHHTSSLSKPYNTGIFDDNRSIDVEPILKTKILFKENDTVIHDVFGEGIVLKIEDDIATIAFSFPYGVKQISAFHPSIKLKSELN